MECIGKKRVKPDGRMLLEKDAVGMRWAEYFERFPNIEKDKEPVIVWNVWGKRESENRW